MASDPRYPLPFAEPTSELVDRQRLGPLEERPAIGRGPLAAASLEQDFPPVALDGEQCHASRPVELRSDERAAPDVRRPLDVDGTVGDVDIDLVDLRGRIPVRLESLRSPPVPAGRVDRECRTERRLRPVLVAEPHARRPSGIGVVFVADEVTVTSQSDPVAPAYPLRGRRVRTAGDSRRAPTVRRQSARRSRCPPAVKRRAAATATDDSNSRDGEPRDRSRPRGVRWYHGNESGRAGAIGSMSRAENGYSGDHPA